MALWLLLLLNKSQVKLPEPMWWLTPCITSVPGDLLHSSDFYAISGMHVGQTFIHTKENKSLKIFLKLLIFANFHISYLLLLESVPQLYQNNNQTRKRKPVNKTQTNKQKNQTVGRLALGKKCSDISVINLHLGLGCKYEGLLCDNGMEISLLLRLFWGFSFLSHSLPLSFPGSSLPSISPPPLSLWKFNWSRGNRSQRFYFLFR